MTIKELCNKCDKCYKCPFIDICQFDDSIYKSIMVNPAFNTDCTRAIIRTAKLLESDNDGRTMSNKGWVDLLQKGFNVSRRSAKEMLHAIMVIKRNDNFNKQFCGSRRK